jgi:hypothetical protein
MLSTIRRRFLSSRLLVIKAAFCQLGPTWGTPFEGGGMSANEQKLDYAGGGLWRPQGERSKSEFLWGVIVNLITDRSIGGEG